MDAPKDIERPKEGKLKCFCRSSWGSGIWYVMDHTGKIKTSGDLYFGARLVNRASEINVDKTIEAYEEHKKKQQEAAELLSRFI